jgi:hypothetical protein
MALMTSSMLATRRDFVQHIAKGSLASAGAWLALHGKAAGATPALPDITREVIINGRKTGVSWFHPRCCKIPGAKPRVFMTLQRITGSDVFHAVHWMTSDDAGKTWTTPIEVPGMGRVPRPDSWQEGVCDVVPQWHPPTRTVLAMGHNVYYDARGVVVRGPEPRWPVYGVMDSAGTWVAQRAKLEWDDPRGSAIYSSNCGQRELFDNGDILVPLTFGPKGRIHRDVSSLRCSFDGRRLTVLQSGTALTLAKGRGLLEPSVIRHHGKVFLTIRAEDGRGYVAASDDGLDWREMQPWSWEDGTPLDMSTTQQHWLAHSEALHLVYTRKTEQNAAVTRWRAPLFMAQVDTASLRLRRETEQIVLPLIGDPAANPKGVALMGNFHPVNVSSLESWVTVGENTIIAGGTGDTLLARIRWKSPNGLCPD